MKSNNNNNSQNKNKNTIKNKKWILLITIWTFLLSMFMSFFSDIILKNVNILLSFIILIIIVLIGIIFDLIGIAVAAANEKPFHSMASNKVKGAYYGIRLLRNASLVSNFCNDVIGDICGIISGASATIIIMEIIELYPSINLSLFTILISSLVASITVGGKAIGKEIGFSKSKEIVLFCGKILYQLDNKLKIKIVK